MCMVSRSETSGYTGDFMEIYDGSNDMMYKKITNQPLCGHGINGNVATYIQGTENEMFIR